MNLNNKKNASKLTKMQKYSYTNDQLCNTVHDYMLHQNRPLDHDNECLSPTETASASENRPQVHPNLATLPIVY